MVKASRQWESLDPPLTPWIVEAVQTLGFERMTPVQASVIPLFMTNKDVVVEAVTGSGKTLAFLIPTIEKIIRLNEPVKAGSMFGIIVAPTRELAEQIHKVLKELLDLGPRTHKESIIRSQLIIGGNDSPHIDLKHFLKRRPHILVATPGRLLDLLSSSQVRASSLEMLVLDEADRLLDLGFDVTLSKILAYLPKQKRAGLFSATISDAVGEIARVGLRNPVKVSVSSGKSQQNTPVSLDIGYMIMKRVLKTPILMTLLHTREYNKAIVYLPTCTSVTFFHSLMKFLQQFKEEDQYTGTELPELFSMHGKLPPGPRHKTLEKFAHCYNKSVLITTDVAARGLDIPEVDLVLQFDAPSDPNMFLHRAGRAGRAGKTGQCIIFLDDNREPAYVDFLKVRKVNLSEKQIPEKHEFAVFDRPEEIRNWMLQDRARHDIALRSFLSFVRFYHKHTASSIFRISSLNMVELANSFYLLRLPKMPELKAIPEDQLPKDGWLGEPIDMDKYAYENSKQEKARLESLEKRRLEALEAVSEPKKKQPKHKSNEAWSAKLERKETAVERREKRKNKQIAKKTAELKENGGDQDSDSDIQVDWKDTVREKKRQKKQARTEVQAFDDL